jgi:hypothetical protein
MRSSLSLVTLVTASMLVACKATEPNTPVPATISIVKGNNQRVVIQEAAPDTIKFRVLDASNGPVANVKVNFTVTNGGTLSQASSITNGAGEVVAPAWTMGTVEGNATLTATIESNPAINAAVVAEVVVSNYDIQLVYVNQGTASQRQQFDIAVRRWREIIANELTNVQLTIDPSNSNSSCGTAPAFNEVVDDLVIFVDLVAIDGPGGVLGSAGPCFIRQSNSIPIAGIMRFDTADLAALEARNQLLEVILHEMGHVIGIGSLWAQKNLRDVSVTDDPIFTGTQARNAFLAPSFGGTNCACRAVPIEGGTQTGTALVHWRESVLRRELMTGFLQQGGVNPLSILTISALADYGYTVRTARAESFTLVSAVQIEGVLTQEPFELREEALRFPIRVVDNEGRVVRQMPRSSAKEY